MKQIIEQLREKPKTVRVQVAFLTALSVTAVIGLTWSTTLPARFEGMPAAGADVVAATTEPNGFFANARANLGQVISAFRGEEEVPDRNTAPSGAYTTDVPARDMNVFAAPKTVVEPVSRREVLIATTTNRTTDH